MFFREVVHINDGEHGGGALDAVCEAGDTILCGADAVHHVIFVLFRSSAPLILT